MPRLKTSNRLGLDALKDEIAKAEEIYNMVAIRIAGGTAERWSDYEILLEQSKGTDYERIISRAWHSATLVGEALFVDVANLVLTYERSAGAEDFSAPEVIGGIAVALLDWRSRAVDAMVVLESYLPNF